MGVAIAAAVLSMAGLVLSTLIKSPAERAAEQAPPTPTILTAAVKSEVLTSTTVLRGSVVAADSTDISPPAAIGATRLVVSAPPKAVGTAVAAGDVLTVISGRPTIALAGAVPSYRDLTPGLNGPDVLQLQQALGALGYVDTDAPGTFGPATQAAVKALYKDRGFEPATTSQLPGSNEDANLKAAADAVKQAQRAVDSAQLSVASTTDVAGHSAALRTLANARSDLADAKASQARIQAASGVILPMAEVAFLPTFPAIIDSVNARVGDILTDSSGPVLTVRGGALAVQGTLSVAQKQLVSVGLKATVTDQSTGDSVAATVTSLRPPAATGGSGPATGSAAGATDTQGYPIELAPDAALSSAWHDADVVVRITIASTPTPVLVVPAAALSTAPDGTVSVLVRSPDGSMRKVAVNAGAAGDDGVQVTPTQGTLQAGDRVVTGQ